MDPIADMLTRLSNANHKLKETVDIPHSKVKAEIARVLKEEGYISGFRAVKEGGFNQIRINLKYAANNERVLQGTKRVSKPSLRKYARSSEVPSVQSGLGTAIISTSQGLMSDQKAKEANVGGEVVCFVW